MNEAAATAVERDEGGDNFIAHIPQILWQRRWWIIVPTVLLAIAGVAAAFLMPTTYRSSATLLVESQELPREIVGTPVTQVIDERIARMRQQILSRPDLVELIQVNDLYAGERRSRPLSEIIEEMRDATTISAVDADIARAPGQSNTVAFNLGFNYPEAAKAQLVTQAYVERFLELDASQTGQQAEATVAFLQEQADGLGTQLREVEGQVERIKAENGLTLAGGNMAFMGGNPGGYESQISALQRENSELTVQLNQEATAETRDPIVVAAETALASARAVYADNHPDVRLAEQRLAEARQYARTNTGRQTSVTGPALRSRIAANNTMIAQLQAARAADQGRQSAALSAQSRAPLIMEQVAQLQSRADGLRSNYERVNQQLMAAQSAARMSSEQKGERLSVIDPPVVPDRPASPNRPMLALGGIAAGLGLGLALALAIEFMLKPIRGVGALNRLLGVPPMVVVPTMTVGETRWQRLRGRLSRLAFWRRRKLQTA